MADGLLPHHADPDLAQAPDGAGLALLQCPRCGGALVRAGVGRIGCGHCLAPVSTPDGILDFVAGSASTDLDAIDYDQFYAISEQNSAHLYRIVKQAAGPLWPVSLGDAVEIGCGTGGFTMAVLRETVAANVVLTDISTKMLGLCRDRLARLADLRTGSVTYATYSGVEACFRPEAFDSCFGTAVVHHIIDVPHFLGQVQRLLKPGGRAFFMEPNLRFHEALTATLAMIVSPWARHATVPQADIARMLNWMAEVHCNIANSGDLDVLAEREDKHLFVSETLEAVAEAAGFGVASALPAGLDPSGLDTIAMYLDQVGISRPTLNLLRQTWHTVHHQHFDPLRAQDQSPSYLVWLEKRPRPKVIARPAASTPDSVDPISRPEALPPTRLCLTFTLRRQPDGLELQVDGWCLTAERVKSMQVTVGGRRHKLPIWRPRLDVQTKLNRDGLYPPVHALCSGVEGTIVVADLTRVDKPMQVIFDVVAVDGRLLRGRSIMLVPNGESRIVQIDQLQPDR